MKNLKILGYSIKKNYSKFSKESQRVFQGLWYSGDKFVCPCCDGTFREFLPAGVNPRPNAKCPRCLSLERHRLIWLFLKAKTNFFSENLKVLHMAPEYLLQKKIKQLPNIDYLSADLNSSLAMVKMDITQIPFEDNHFDVILCNHVLEHIPDDHKAMTELFRVLKPGGWALLQVPMDLNREQTFEDPNIVSPEERERNFGQEDHVRMYGRDYKDRLEKAGFTVKVDSYVRELSDEMVERYSLMKEHDIYIGNKL